MHLLVTGATGYIGGRLIPRLLERGHRVRVLVRDHDRIAGRPWLHQVDVIEGDVLDPATLTAACAGIEAAFYLVHSLGQGADYAALDRRAAGHFAHAARSLRLVVYLGGLLPAGSHASEHLRSRAEVGNILRASLPVTEFRAGPIIGSGSASFEMVRYLTERLPVMVAPRWINNAVQPIAVRDILAYLLEALDHPPLGVVDVGATPLTFREMMLGYAAARGWKRRILPVPVLAPWLAAQWVGLVTPISNRLAVPLIRGILHPVVGDTTRARALFPHIHPISYRDAVDKALEKIRAGIVETHWSGALGGTAGVELADWEGLVRETRTLHLNTTPDKAYQTFSSLGGERGWLVWKWAWECRGLLDQILGGPGLRRGRRHPHELLPGESLDFWRVERVEPGRLLRLRAEMKVPGRAWLQWEAVPEESGTLLVQTAIFQPDGLGGFLYWYGIYPLHQKIFSDMIHAIGKEATAPPVPPAR
jgi:uncharacterized protein YbjT (DUF2867 family)